MNEPHCHKKNRQLFDKNSQMTINNTLQEQLFADALQNC